MFEKKKKWIFDSVEGRFNGKKTDEIERKMNSIWAEYIFVVKEEEKFQEIARHTNAALSNGIMARLKLIHNSDVLYSSITK